MHVALDPPVEIPVLAGRQLLLVLRALEVLAVLEQLFDHFFAQLLGHEVNERVRDHWDLGIHEHYHAQGYFIGPHGTDFETVVVHEILHETGLSLIVLEFADLLLY